MRLTVAVVASQHQLPSSWPNGQQPIETSQLKPACDDKNKELKGVPKGTPLQNTERTDLFSSLLKRHADTELSCKWNTHRGSGTKEIAERAGGHQQLIRVRNRHIARWSRT